jgi:hypothetical protein
MDYFDDFGDGNRALNDRDATPAVQGISDDGDAGLGIAVSKVWFGKFNQFCRSHGQDLL